MIKVGDMVQIIGKTGMSRDDEFIPIGSTAIVQIIDQSCTFYPYYVDGYWYPAESVEELKEEPAPVEAADYLRAVLDENDALKAKVRALEARIEAIKTGVTQLEGMLV